MKLKAVIYAAEAGGFWAEVPAVPGCLSQGETLEEVRQNIRQALAGCLEVMQGPRPIELHPVVEEIELMEETLRPPPTRWPCQAGSAKGKVWMAPDFDAPLEEFGEYME